MSLSNSTRSASPKAPSEFPTPKPIPDGEILERVTSIARSMKRRRELPSQKNMVSETINVGHSDHLRDQSDNIILSLE